MIFLTYKSNAVICVTGIDVTNLNCGGSSGTTCSAA